MLLRDRLLARIAEMGEDRDDARLAQEVLGIRNAPPALARRLVEQALVVEDRREQWLRLGTQVCERAPVTPGVYVLRAADGRALYVGKANHLRRRLRTHFAERRWRAIRPELAQTASVEWCEVGSEIEALVTEAEWIRELAPAVNVQVADPEPGGRAVPASLWRDTVVIVPSAEADRVVLVAARAAGPVQMVRARRDGVGLRPVVARLRTFFGAAAAAGSVAKGAVPKGSVGAAGGRGELPWGLERREGAGDASSRPDVRDGLAPLVFSWLAGRGAGATRLDPHDASSARELMRRLQVAFADDRLFRERIVVVRSRFRTTPKRP